MREQRRLRKRWRTVHVDSAPEQSLLYHHRKGCQKFKPDIRWGDARLEHREPYGAWKPSRPPHGIEFDEAISSGLFAQHGLRARQVHFAGSAEVASVAQTTTGHTAPDTTNKANTRWTAFRWFRRTCTPSRGLAATEDEKELARQWAAFDYVPQPAYVSVWNTARPTSVRCPPPKGSCAFLKRLAACVPRQGTNRTETTLPSRFQHAHPFDFSPWPPLPPFGSKQYTSGTTGEHTLANEGVDSWTRTNSGGRHPSRTLLYAADSWMACR